MKKLFCILLVLGLIASWSLAAMASSADQTYVLTYDANGGSNAPSEQTGESGKNITISSTIPERFGFNFHGWVYDSGSSSGISYADIIFFPGNSLKLAANITLYAVWHDASENATAPVTSQTYHTPFDIPGAPRYLYYKIAESGEFTFESHGGLDTVGTLYDSSGKQLASDDNSGQESNFRINYGLDRNATCYLKVALKSNTATSDDIEVMMSKTGYTVTFNANGGTVST